jgi:hypothetical protein
MQLLLAVVAVVVNMAEAALVALLWAGLPYPQQQLVLLLPQQPQL